MSKINYGLPYMGSKNKIAEWVVKHLPSAETLVDLFAGGCAITHCAMLSSKYDRIIANDITESATFFKECAEGKHSRRTEWISREDFQRLKDTDIFVRMIYSFGNNHKAYLFSRDIEPYKRALHQAIVDGNYQPMLEQFGMDFSTLDAINEDVFERMQAARKLVFECYFKEGKLKRKGSHYYYEDEGYNNIERLQRLQSLENFQRLQSLQNRGGYFDLLPELIVSQNDYQDVEIPENSIIYCDIPYKDKAKYLSEFDYERFYQWARVQTRPIFISEYWMPDDFVCVAENERRSTLSAQNNNCRNIEKIFTLPKFKDL